MSAGNTQLYAPRPQGPPSHLYPPPTSDNALHVPPSHPSPSPSRFSDDNSAIGYKKDGRIGVDYRDVTRTPSPTPSEAETLANKTRTCNISSFKKYLHLSYFKNPRNLISFIVTLIIIGILIAFVVEQDNIAKALRPAGAWLRKTPGAWLIPIAIMIVLSFPPLFGHELVALLCGEFWGVWIGFGIVAAGTIIGELVTYYTFRYCCRARAAKTEEKDLRYALLAEVIREGGLKMAIMVRYGAIPGHITTAIFATCGMEVWVFLIAAFVALPKQFASVYLGTGTVDASGNMKLTKAQTIIKYAVIALTVLLTVLAMRYINAKIDAAKHRVVYRRRKARQAKLAGHSSSSSSSSAAAAAASSFSLSLSRGPAADADDVGEEETAPLTAHAAEYGSGHGHGYGRGSARPSMDMDGARAQAHVSPPAPATARPPEYGHDQRVPAFAPPRSPPPPPQTTTTTVYGVEARYDDAYGGGRDAFAAGGLRTPGGHVYAEGAARAAR